MSSKKKWVFAVQGLPKKTEADADAEMVLLKHPRTRRMTPFMFLNNVVYEMQTCYPQLGEERGYASWFVGQSVVGDGALVLVTPIDPLFLALPILVASGTQMRPLDQLLLSPSEAPETRRLIKCKHLQLKYVCDINDKYGPDSIFYRYNEAKTLTWLRAKVDRLCSTAPATALAETAGAVGIASSFVVAGQRNSPPSVSHGGSGLVVSALKIIGEYLSNDMLEKLAKTYDVKLEVLTKKQKLATSPKKPTSKPVQSLEDQDLDDMIEDAAMNRQVSDGSKMAKKFDTVAVASPPNNTGPQSRWDMQMDVSGDSMSALLNMAPMPGGKRPSPTSSGVAAQKKSKINSQLAKVKVKSKSMMSFFTVKKRS
jgi:ribonuclease H2 subunit B